MAPRTDPVELARDLIRCRSVTPDDSGAMDVVETALSTLGFECHRLTLGEAGDPPIENLYARLGTEGPNLCFAGHTDVVPPGDEADWTHPPFAAEIHDGILYGRGAVDMKGAVASFIAAVGRMATSLAGPDGRWTPSGFSLSLLITGDEEGPAFNGTRRVLEWLADRGERIDACVVGEPTNATRIGDTMKIGRRGSMSGFLSVEGAQAHAAYARSEDNAVHRMIALLHALTAAPIDEATDHFDPTSLQVVTVDVGNPTVNVVPPRAAATINTRFNDRHTSASLQALICEKLDAVDRDYAIRWHVSGENFLTEPGVFTELVASSVADATGSRPAYSTSGGSSDARFIRHHCPVVEFGLNNATIHKTNEQTPVADLEALTAVYQALITRVARGEPLV
ncbi:succinyl-diaminopimelate desuccinylase [Fodinicurvata sp. EGI_FJ10296]|uniref:succinyl-diaminopimelate desuccinylase n=1 Tax=Fodinicurvata sp. EGI_FJ10296 TaxID=3231908 RepID=UPI003453B2D0